MYVMFKAGEGYFEFKRNRRRPRKHPHPNIGRIFSHSRPVPHGDTHYQLFHKEVWLGPFVVVLHHYQDVDL